MLDKGKINIIFFFVFLFILVMYFLKVERIKINKGLCFVI